MTNERLGSGRTTITAGRKDELLIADPSEAGRVRWVDTGVDTERRAERCRPDEGSAGGPTSQPGPGECVMPKDPCPRCCPPPRRPRRREPSQPRPGPAGGRGDRCVPGGSGVPDDCIVTTVQDSWAISVNVCAPDPVPCSVHLDFPIGTVQRTARAVVATSIDGQRLAVLDADSLRLLYEHRPTSGVFRTMTARAAETVMLVFDTGTVVALDPTPVLPALDLDLVNAATPVVFDGQPDTVNWQHGGIQTGTYYVMLVPVLEAGQAFHGDIDSYFAIADLQAALEDVPAFFREVSYNQPPDVVGFNVVFRIFGVDTPLLYSGPPVQIGKGSPTTGTMDGSPVASSRLRPYRRGACCSSPATSNWC